DPVYEGTMKAKQVLVVHSTALQLQPGETAVLSVTGFVGSSSLRLEVTGGATNCSLLNETLTALADGFCAIRAIAGEDATYAESASEPIVILVSVPDYADGTLDASIQSNVGGFVEALG